ncbi:GTP cyclohydrolase 1-like [Schistocerca gregaria]|uniref:GTP cyclohydrolase 1-like n=1 Tax=Schistocerca gregaria TaxID=7010 RepID=UPI00211DDCED|nr:GTP cyclohydrolase 1-like [Schistocerca gregaria]
MENMNALKNDLQNCCEHMSQYEIAKEEIVIPEVLPRRQSENSKEAAKKKTKTREQFLEHRRKNASNLLRSCANIIESLGEDITREGIKKTPQRMAQALSFFTEGYEMSLSEVVNDAIFSAESSDMVIIRNIEIFSMCEHHFLPFFGKLHVGYLPRGHIIGLSKIPRIAEIFSKRLQVQERLTVEIGQAIQEAIKPLAVGVILECTHLCMVMRGVQKPGSSTVTSSMLGLFREDGELRKDFLSSINR